MNGLPADKQQQKESSETAYLLTKPLSVGFSLGIQAMAWAAFTFLFLSLIWLFLEDKFLSSIGLTVMLFWIASLLGIFKFSIRIRVDNQSIAVKSWIRKRELNWDEIEQIRLRKYLADIAICGNKKKMVITSPSNWRGQDKYNLLEFFNAQIEARDIELIDTNF